MAKISPMMAVPVVVFFGFVGLALVGMGREDPDNLPSALAGKAAPPVTVTEFPGKAGFDDATLRDGQVKLVNYWASWCGPCRAEHPNLEQMSKGGITIYGVNYKDQLGNAEAFLSELGDPYTALGRDESGRMALNWGLYGVPETYVIDGDGTVILRFPGPITQRVMKETILPALKKAAE
ncbi:DsbE family thiol:disulfide interchange protein [Phaeobacter sp. HF9A]|uniref:DsbE family thiol:disulfide interchange protein n=1 Tax=Phaeobacter sp. HF9A TaxID=2721561 RepID=UPI0014321909|nr:DsbE family thiol:disulfide interchange protein [Phaeobacter sp. HF9A]NIZ13899.1 DsbE family thiol:disulfide interchange protein [Phaeobacter sp. HF9A]